MPRRSRENIDKQPLRLGPIRNASEVARCIRRLCRIRATLRLDRERYKDLIDGLEVLHDVYGAQEAAKQHADLLAALPQLKEREHQYRAHVLRLVKGGTTSALAASEPQSDEVD
jgi:hypothetical protein